MKKSNLYWLCQIGGWFFFVMVEFIGYGNTFGYNQLLVLNVAVNFLFGLALTHLYRKFLIKTEWLNLPLSKLLPRAVLGVGVVSFTLTMLNIYLDRLTVPLMGQLPVDWVLILNYLFNWSKYILMWALVYHLFQYWEKSLEAERSRYQMQAILRENQYNNLKTQLNPHFLFNSLNGIRTLVDLDPDMSKEAIMRLSNLLRSSLQMSKNKTVSLEQEMATVESYLLIEKIRFDDRLQYAFNLDKATLNAQIPPMMLQTLVENAVKHGISKLKNGGQVLVNTIRKGNRVQIEILNSGKYEPTDSENGAGLGLENTKERLKLLFEDQASFEIKSLDENFVIATIELPL
ncbi:MAG: sensor histidine kinase [Bacteroidia bacterium]